MFLCVYVNAASTAVTSGPLYRYNEDKTLAWVKKKVLFLPVLSVNSLHYILTD